MPIGLAAFTRYQNKQNEIRVIVQDRIDTSCGQESEENC